LAARPWEAVVPLKNVSFELIEVNHFTSIAGVAL
jgi:hypothetical protein